MTAKRKRKKKSAEDGEFGEDVWGEEEEEEGEQEDQLADMDFAGLVLLCIM